MKKNIFVLLILLTSNIIQAQNMNTVIFDEMADEDILIGYCNREGLSGDYFNYWFNSTYTNYNVDVEILGQIPIQLFDDLKIKIILGTWCEDSQHEIPRIFKILDKLIFDFNNFTLIAVNKLKMAENTEVDKLNIEFVPTIIFYKNNTEIGRIVESPEKSLEKDMLNIISSI